MQQRMAVREAAKTVRNIRGVYLKECTAKVKGDKIVEYRSVVKISFVVDEATGHPEGECGSAQQEGSPASAFAYASGELHAEAVPLASIAERFGTPCYVYGAATFSERYRALDEAFSPVPHAIHYALKANSALTVLRTLRALGAQADANSVGEIEVALRAGFIPEQVVFTGVGKSRDELERAVALGVKTINAESPGELARIDEVARAQGTRARVALRVNPEVDGKTHPHITTGLKRNKFGVAPASAFDVCIDAARRPGLHLVGLHAHIKLIEESGTQGTG